MNDIVIDFVSTVLMFVVNYHMEVILISFLTYFGVAFYITKYRINKYTPTGEQLIEAYIELKGRK